MKKERERSSNRIQVVNNFGVAVLLGEVDGRLGAVVEDVHLDLVIAQPLHNVHVAVHGGQVERRVAVVVGARLQRGAVVVQHLQAVQVVVLGAQVNRIVALKQIKEKLRQFLKIMFSLSKMHIKKGVAYFY